MMGLHMVGNPNDYGGDDSPPEHGRDTCVYQELQPVREALRKWLVANRNDLDNDDLCDRADRAAMLLDDISDELNQPL